MSQVLVVQDERAMADIISVNLRDAGHEVTVATTATQALSVVDRVLPDLVLHGWQLPSSSGLQLVKQWRRNSRTRELPIIMLSADAQEDDRVAGLDAGADDYFTQPCSSRELVARVHAVLRRRAPETLGVEVQAGGLKLDPATRRVTWTQDEDVREIKVAPTVFRLLQFFMTYPERVHSRAYLLDKVWGDHVFLQERSIDVHVKRLRHVLAPLHCSHSVETVRGSGYRFTAQHPSPLSPAAA